MRFIFNQEHWNVAGSFFLLYWETFQRERDWRENIEKYLSMRCIWWKNIGARAKKESEINGGALGGRWRVSVLISNNFRENSILLFNSLSWHENYVSLYFCCCCWCNVWILMKYCIDIFIANEFINVLLINWNVKFVE